MANDLPEFFDDRLAVSSAPQRSSALSNKLTSVLSDSYAGSEIRDVLRTFDEREIKNTANTRRSLRLNVQKEAIERNGAIIKDFGQVAEQLKHIGTTVKSLNQCCEDIRQHVMAAHGENAPVLEEVSVLLNQKQELETKKLLLDVFNTHFVVSEGALMILSTSTESVDENFFAVLKRVKKIHADCQVLLGTENQRLGLELMDQSSRNLNIGYQKLYRWVQKEFKNLDLENSQISSIMRRALRLLAERPTLFQSCLDFFAEAREHVLTDAFYAALTGSSSENEQNLMTKPIEFNAHDPLRYVGDMLAWTHSTTISEREALETLFVSEGDGIRRGIEAGREAEPWSAGDNEAFHGRKALGDLVDRNVAGVARALRQRIEQMLRNQEDTVLLYKIANLINFYFVTFSKLLGSDSSLLETLSALEKSSLRQFQVITLDNVSSIHADTTSLFSNLGIPDFLDEALTQLAALERTYDSSLTPASSRESEFAPIIKQAVNPYLAACEKMTNQSSEPVTSIFLVNCYLATKSTLSTYDFVQTRASELDGQLESLSSILIEYQHAFFLHTSGLHPLLSVLAPLDDSKESLLRIPTLPTFTPQALADASQTLDDFLPSALMDAMENLKRLSNIKVAQEITAEAAGRFCEDFEFVEGRLGAVDELCADGKRDGIEEKEEEHVVQEPPPLRSVFPRTSGEIRVLLS